MLCYEWQPMANEEWGYTLRVMNSEKGAYCYVSFLVIASYATLTLLSSHLPID